MAMQDDGAALKDCETDSRPEFSACAARLTSNFREIRLSFEVHLTLGLHDNFLRYIKKTRQLEWKQH